MVLPILAAAALLAPRPAAAMIPRDTFRPSLDPAQITQPYFTQNAGVAPLTDSAQAPEYVLVVVEWEGSLYGIVCRNDPVNNTDPLGLETVEEFEAQLLDAIRQQAHVESSVENYLGIVADFESGAEQVPLVLDPATGKTSPLSPDLAGTWMMIRAAQVHGAANVMDPDRGSFMLMGEQARAGLAQSGIRELYEHAAFLEWAGGMDAGAIDPHGLASFDTDSPEFKAGQRQAFWIKINPSSDIARHCVLGQYGQAATAYGKEVAIWVGIGLAGEFAGSGRLAFRSGFGGGVSAMDRIATRTMTKAEWQQFYRLQRAAASGRDLVTVSHWGSSGLQSGAWVMKGPVSRWTFLRSFKWEPNPTNIRVPFREWRTGQNFIVPREMVRWPDGTGIEGAWKGIYGQRRFRP